jgi:hypothetical protein
MEDNLFLLLKMEDYLNFFENGKTTSIFFENARQPQPQFLKMEDDL